MMYKGFDIYYIQPMIEKCGIDESGNSVSFRDAWQTEDGWYQADSDTFQKIFKHKGFVEIKTLIDAFVGESK